MLGCLAGGTRGVGYVYAGHASLKHLYGVIVVGLVDFVEFHFADGGGDEFRRLGAVAYHYDFIEHGAVFRQLYPLQPLVGGFVLPRHASDHRDKDLGILGHVG